MNLLTLESLSKDFTIGRGNTLRAVDDVNLTVAHREVLGVVGNPARANPRSVGSLSN